MKAVRKTVGPTGEGRDDSWQISSNARIPTTHASHEAADLDSAIIAGKQQCIRDWSSGDEEGEGPWNLESVHCLGVAAGDIEILHWEDQTS